MESIVKPSEVYVYDIIYFKCQWHKIKMITRIEQLDP